MKMRMLNLYELIKYYPAHSHTFAYYANVTPELLYAALRGEEELTGYEIYCISRHFGVPLGVLSCRRLIELDISSYRHRAMISRLGENLAVICRAINEGDEDACYYKRQNGLDDLIELIKDFQIKGKVSYCRYLGVKELTDRTIIHMKMAQKKPRGLKGGAV